VFPWQYTELLQVPSSVKPEDITMWVPLVFLMWSIINSPIYEVFDNVHYFKNAYTKSFHDPVFNVMRFVKVKIGEHCLS